MRVGRNESCPCGSGQKYKNCCESKNARGSSRGMWLLIGAIVVIAAVGLIAGISDGEKNRPSAGPRQAAGGGTLPAAGNTPRAQPPGPTPPGKVWSPEHGHWHDANPAGESPIQVQTSKAPINLPVQQQAKAPVPQPPGTPPPGKVWSPEHGHWHDAPK